MRRFPSGAEIPRVILGTSRLGSVLPDALTLPSVRVRAFRQLDVAFELGLSALDIAASYQIGGTERVIGAWMRSRQNRERLYLIGKGGHPLPVVKPNRLTPRDLADDLHASLRRLRTDHLDLYLLHRDHPAASLDELASAMADHQRSGKILAWGVSNWTHPRIVQLDRVAREAGLPTIVASSPHFSLAEWERPPWKGCVSIAGDAEARAFHARTQLPVLAYSPLGRGFFSSSSGHRKGADPVYGSMKNLARLERAEILAQRRGLSAAEIALAYLFNQPFPVYAIVAASTEEHLRRDLGAVPLRLSPDELQWLEHGK